MSREPRTTVEQSVELPSAVIDEVARRLDHVEEVDRAAVRDLLHDHAEVRTRFVDESGRSAVDQVVERV